MAQSLQALPVLQGPEATSSKSKSPGFELPPCERHSARHDMPSIQTLSLFTTRTTQCADPGTCPGGPVSSTLTLMDTSQIQQTSRKATLVFFPALKQAQPCPIWTPWARSCLFSVISHGLDLHVAYLRDSLGLSSLCFSSFNYYLKLTCPTSYLLGDPVILNPALTPRATQALGKGTATRLFCAQLKMSSRPRTKHAFLKRCLFTR